MNRVAWLTCALLALTRARIYERCELARELQVLGVSPDDIATWVCIAYHESRFDTAANNPYSGDHGIFQISELYWCGPGKACGLPCSALRDEDISNDLQCALQVHEEHTRLQGNGFLAWVVYPQHCKHNTKKYLVDCDNSVKSSLPITKSRTFAYEERYLPNTNYTTQNIENLLPPYLAIGNIFRGSYGKVLDQSKGRIDWYNYKINNIDDLQLPSSFVKPSQPVTEPSTTTTTTTTQTTTTYIPPVMPWRSIETNQFRKKQLFDTKPATEKPYFSITVNHLDSSKPSTTYRTPSTTTTTQGPFTSEPTTNASRNTVRSTKAPSGITWQTWSTTHRATTVKTPNSTKSPVKMENTTLRPQTTLTPTRFTFAMTSKPFFASTEKKTTAISTTEWPIISAARTKSWSTITNPTITATASTTARTTAQSTTRWWTTPRPTTTRWTTSRPTTTRWTTARPTTTSTTTVRPTTTWTTAKPTTSLSTPVSTSPAITSTRSRSYQKTAIPTSTRNSKPDFSWYTFTSRTSSTVPATKLQSTFEFPTSRPITHSATTLRQQTTTPKPKTTQSIFDLYLNPTKPPKLPVYRFDSAPESRYRLKIFASGTTTPAPSIRTSTQKRTDDSGNATKSQIKRQNLYNPHYS